PAVVATDANGKIIAIEGAGDIRCGEEALLDAASHLIALTLDRQPLTRSTRLLLLPMGAGEVEIPHAARWRKPTVVVGAVERRHWKTYESFDPILAGDRLRVKIDADRNLSMVLVVESGDEQGAIALAEERVLRPWAIQRNA
ncbi:MAG TPA: hypothetical protein VG672_01075, partial [Bryobacteraceae bacterium]|nr:hypothetical protein [Bryobacteraceae bacterium]